MNENFLNINIESNETLLAACDVLHDAYLDVSEIKYKENEGTWEAPFEREFLEDPSKIEYQRKYLIFNTVSFPVVHSVLSLKNIRTYKLEDKLRIQKYTFNECKIKDAIYKLDFCGDMIIYFTFNIKPMGKLKDQYLLTEKKSYLTIGKPL